MAKSPSSSLPFLDLEELEKYDNLLLFAQALVEGTYLGRHRSPREGQAVEFSDYRPYVPGEDVAKIDWRIYARSKQWVCRRHHHETDMTVHLMVDGSASMAFGQKKFSTKGHQASRIAAALSYLITRQNEKVSYTRYNQDILEHFPASKSRRHLMKILNALEKSKDKQTTNLPQALQLGQGLFKQKGRLLILSDFWEDTEELFEALHWYRHHQFEIMLMKIHDPGERNLHYGQRVRLIDSETGARIDLHPAHIQKSYQKAYDERERYWIEQAKLQGIQTAIVSTQNPYHEALHHFWNWGQRGTP